jgi:uncharacterized protein (DUF58 family)
VTIVPRPRRRTLGLLGGATVLFLAGTSVQAGWLLVLSACLAGVAVAGFVLPRRMTGPGVHVERRTPAEAFQGDRVRVSLVVSNRSRRLRLALDVTDEHLEPSRAFVASLGPGQTVVVETERVAVRRGRHEDAPVTLASSAPFGVAEHRRRRAVYGSTIVYPRLVRLDELPFLESAPTPERAIHAAPRRGTGPDYLGIREYRVGDSMRHVHWPSTARHGALMVREFEREQTRRLAVVIDAVADAAPAAGASPLDVCCSVAASVAFAAQGAGQGVRLVSSVGGRVVSATRSDPAATLTWLAELRPGGGLSMAELAAGLGEEVLGAATVLLTVPTWRANGPEVLVPAVADLVLRAPRVVVVLVEVHSFEGMGRVPRLGPDGVDELEDAVHASGAVVRRLAAGSDIAAALSRSPAGTVR